MPAEDSVMKHAVGGISNLVRRARDEAETCLEDCIDEDIDALYKAKILLENALNSLADVHNRANKAARKQAKDEELQGQGRAAQ